MTAKKEQERGRGKPLGTRTKPELYMRIMNLLRENKESKGDGMTAFAISGALAIPDPTIRLYMGDLLKEKHVSVKMFHQMTIYRPTPLGLVIYAPANTNTST